MCGEIKAFNLRTFRSIKRCDLQVEWAKNLSPFPDLAMDDKIILLKNYAPQHLILMPAFRSPDTTRVCLFNNTYMSRDQGAELNGSFFNFRTRYILVIVTF